MADLGSHDITKFNNILVDIVKHENDSLKSGYVNKYSYALPFTILLHCIENYDIFTKEKRNKINTYIDEIIDDIKYKFNVPSTGELI